jgi:hypothetical protein
MAGTEETDMSDFENRLRASLDAHARQAPNGDSLAEQIIADVDRTPAPTPLHRPHLSRRWTFPLLAAAAVAAVALTLVGINQFGHGSDNDVAQQQSISPSTSPRTPTTSTTVSPSPSSPRPTPTTTVTVLSGDTQQLLTHVSVIDLTFVSNDDGWALATADCLNGSGKLCTAMLRTNDGGQAWRSIANPPVNVPPADCADPCVDHIRFANDKIGYAFGASALFMTTDGGQHWTRQSGGASALETLDENVIRVSTDCLPGCPYRVQVAPIGSTSWQAVTLPGVQAGMNSGVSLARTGSRAFIDIYGHTAGGAQNATSVLYSSTNDGATWTRRGEPCPQIGTGAAGNEVDSTAMTSAADGSVTLLCTPRGGSDPQFTTTSTDAGATFHHGKTDALGSAPVSALGAGSSAVLVVANGDTFRSSDSGQRFTRAGANGGTTPGDAKWFGFESTTVGRAVSEGGRAVWTTRDGGKTWTSYTFS